MPQDLKAGFFDLLHTQVVPIDLLTRPSKKVLANGRDANASRATLLPLANPVTQPSVIAPAAEFAELGFKERLGIKSFTFGSDLGRKSGSGQREEALIKCIEAQSARYAAEAQIELSDFTQKRRIAEIAALDQEIELRIEDRDHALAEMRRKAEEQAGLGVRPLKPSISVTFERAASIALLGSLAPSFYPMFGGLDESLRWALSAVCAGPIAISLVKGMLPAEDGPVAKETETSFFNKLPVSPYHAALLLGGGMVLIRLAVSHSATDYWLTAGSRNSALPRW